MPSFLLLRPLSCLRPVTTTLIRTFRLYPRYGHGWPAPYSHRHHPLSAAFCRHRCHYAGTRLVGDYECDLSFDYYSRNPSRDRCSDEGEADTSELSSLDAVVFLGVSL